VNVVATRALLLCLAWTLAGTIAFARQHLAQSSGLGLQLVPAYAEWLTCYLPWGVLSLAILPIEQRFPLGRSGWLRHLVVLALVSVPMTIAAWLLTALFGAIVGAATGRTAHPIAVPGPVPVSDLLGHTLLYWTAVAGSTGLRTLVEARDNERRAARLGLEKAQLETSLRQAELDALRMRLQPHFLFNSLQNISVLIQHDPATASRMLTRLGDLLRASLDRDREAETTLATEIALTRAYVAVEEMRFGDRLSSVVDVGPGTEQALVPTFLLQPIVENALRHGLAEIRRRGVLTIRSRRDGDDLVLVVRDNGVGLADGMSPARFGIGLGATCERLARLYGDRQALALQSPPEGGTEVTVTLPFHLATTEVAQHAHARAAGADR
jgi:two-component system, LytTR family, sensor kinase